MEPVAGSSVFYRLLPDAVGRTAAVVVAWDDVQIRLRVGSDAGGELAPERNMVILEADGETEHYGLVTGRDSDVVTLKRLMTGKRGYFRVSDVIPVVCKRMDAAVAPRGSVTVPGYGLPSGPDQPDDTVSPKLWSVLTDLNAKLGLILEHLRLESTGLTRAEPVPVNISASGIRLRLREKVAAGDLVEIRMLLSGTQPAAVVAYGTVVRVDELPESSYETALRFTDLDHDVQDTIIQYTLYRQREIIRKLKQA